MALTHIAHVGPTDRSRFCARRLRNDFGRRRLHFHEGLVDQLEIKHTEPLVLGLHHFVRDGRPQEPHRRSNAGSCRDNDSRDIELFGHPGGVQRPAAAESNQCPARQALAAFDGVHPGCPRHVFVDHLADAERGRFDAQPQRTADMRRDRLVSCVLGQCQIAARKPVGIDPADRQIGVCHGRQ